MSTRKRGGKAAGNSRKRKGEEPEGLEETPTTEQTSVTAEETAGTGTLNADHCVEKENRGNTDTSPCKLSRKTAHAQTRDNTRGLIPLGKPKSGRVWKDRNKQRFSALLRDKPLRSSWEKKMEAKREKQLVKKYQQELKDQKAKEKEDKRKRRQENLRRREENEKKAEIVQVIRNTAKLKRMKKKQLRKIEKRDTLSALQKTPPAVKKAGK